MPTLNLVAKLTMDDLLLIISALNDDELAEFEIRFEQLWLSRSSSLDKEAAQLATARRLSPRQQVRLQALLEKNREESLTKAEEIELDAYLTDIDQALEQTAADLLELAKQRQRDNSSGTR